MNTSNRFNLETLARQRQVEIEKHIRQVALLRNVSSPRSLRQFHRRWKIGAASFSLLSLLALIILAYIR
jgi:hypothetical protein